MTSTFDFTHNGEPISLLINDHNIAAEMLKEKTFYEHWLLDFIREHFKGGIFVDVGANTGNHAIFFSKFCTNHVIAIEPLQESYSLLCHNIRNNNHKDDRHIEPIQVAISNVEGYGEMFVPAINTPGSTMLKQVGRITTNQVRITTLDSLLADFNNIKLLKIDVEGNEVECIQGGLGIIEKWKPEIFVEIWREAKFNQIEALLLPYGYQMKERYCHAPVYHFSCDQSIKRTFRKPS